MIIMLGSAGAGKSVQSQLLSRDLGYQWVSTGMLLRAHSDENLKSELNKGALITDEVVEDVLSRAIASYAHPSEIILDGFPRKVSQAKWLFDWAQANKFKLNAVVHLLVSPEIARKRLYARHREDDTEEVISRRFKEYQTSTMQIVDAFKNLEVAILEVNADRSVEDVHAETLAALNKILKKS